MKFTGWSVLFILLSFLLGIDSFYVNGQLYTKDTTLNVRRANANAKVIRAPQLLATVADRPANDIARMKVASVKDTIAKTMGYALGIGAMSLYTPIIYKLITTRDSSGFSIQTWILNVVGTMLAISYPIKRGFSFSTYVELTAVLVQGIAVLGLVCTYQGLLPQFLMGLVPALGIFTAFALNKNVPEEVVKALQLASIAVCTSANIPQIILTFQRQSASWSGITALLSTIGALIRIFTTLQLTKDKVALVGYSLGCTTNGILLGQVVWFNYLRK